MKSERLWTADELATICKARWRGAGVDVGGITYLPERVQPGDLFVALVYQGTDYHAQIGKALANGARAAMVSRIPDELPGDVPLLVTKKMRQSLFLLAEAARARSQGRFIAVTAWAGKTFMKDTLAYLLSQQAPTGKTRNNDNDTTGVSITLAHMPPDIAYGVVEVSRAMTGDVANSVRPKAKLVRPKVAIIGRIGSGEVGNHRAHFLTIATDKSQIMEGLEPGGTIVLNRDDAHVFDDLYARAKALGIANIHSYGTHEEADICLLKAERCAQGFAISLRLHGQKYEAIIGVNGRHLVENAMGVIGGMHALGADVPQALRDLADVHESPGRGNRYAVALPDGEALLLDYTRNATLLALNASLHTLTEMQPGPGGRRVLVLSDMTDLPEDEDRFYQDLVAAMTQLGVDQVFVAGDDMVTHFYEKLPHAKRGGCAPDTDRLAPLVQAAVRAGDVILAQGWRKMKVNRVVKALVGAERYVPW